MNPDDTKKWQSDVLGHILLALAASKELRDVLVFKGALILNIRLGTTRMSLDIDSNLIQDFVMKFPEKEDQEGYLKKVLTTAIDKYFDRQDTVRYELDNLKIIRSPLKKNHPRGWDAFLIKIKIIDHQNSNVRSLPALAIDVAAPEALSEHSFSEIDLGGFQVKAYTLERIAGEKLRAFLSTLPSYRAKVSKPGEALRVKDLYDLVRIHRERPIENKMFWERSGKEFKLACSSRYVDCHGLETFQENWDYTKNLYETDTTLPKDVEFDEVERVILVINGFFKSKAITPFTFPLPNSEG